MVCVDLKGPFSCAKMTLSLPWMSKVQVLPGDQSRLLLLLSHLRHVLAWLVWPLTARFRLKLLLSCLNLRLTVQPLPCL
jgi:hypothetical protein